MEKIGLNNQIEKKFQSPQEEIEYLRKQIQEREQQIESVGSQPDREKVIEHTISDYRQNKPEEVLEKGHIVPEKNRQEIVLQLQPEEHDDKISELYGMLEQKGVLNTIDIVDKMNDPHISDDFHRFLVQYIREGYTVKGLKDKSHLAKSLKRILFEITLPDRGGEDREQNLQQLISMMEQFYYGMLHISEGDKDDYLTLEIANSVGSRQFVFYISVSLRRRGLFEKQFLSFFPNARILEQKDDFNVFNPKGASVGSFASLEKTPARPLRTYDEFQNDPLKVLLNVFSKLDTTKEGAGIQLIFKPSGTFYQKNYSKALSRLEKGEKPGDELYMRNTTTDKFMNTVSGLFNSGFNSKKDDEKKEAPKIDSSLIELIKKKIAKPIVSTNIRVVSSGETRERAESILSDIESAFNQFDSPISNQIKFANLKDRHMKKLFKEFTFRSYTPSIEVPLNLAELATIMHFPQEKTSISSQLKSSNFATAAAPVNLAEEGILLGINEHQGTETNVYLSKEDRLRHLYTIGQTGTGKTNFLKSLIIQDIQNGEGVCMIDPHGNDIQDVLANIPPERYDDVIYFDPANTENLMALNMLEYDPNFPEQKIFVVNELFGIFMKLYGSNPESMGPMFEQYFRNAAGLVVEDPESGNTLLDISRVLSDEKYRKLKLS
ncbi:MAG: helicase HerA domain-containing protein, partial [Bacteriovoracia bacterium]